TDQFPNNAQDLTPAMLQIVQAGGLDTGGFNFDAKLRRQSLDPNDLYLAHIAGIDTLARALLAAEAVIVEKRFAKLREERYAGWNAALGKKIMANEYTLSTLADHAVKSGIDPKPRSGKQELFESIIAGACRF
ncbi:MAG: xylose isomerase, partial [Alphaproteobacteria bacterium]|nr:xylose isomerase [Alphaproteobacteria bacterium]